MILAASFVGALGAIVLVIRFYRQLWRKRMPQRDEPRQHFEGPYLLLIQGRLHTVDEIGRIVRIKR